MANEIMQSLFGLNASDTAEALRKKQQAEDIAFAQLTPSQKGAYLSAQSGRDIASGVGQLFGYVPPQLQRVRDMEEAISEVHSSGIDFADPTKLYPAMADALNKRGLKQEAAQVLFEGSNLYDDYIKAQAAIKRAEQTKQTGTMEERDRTKLAAAELKVRNGAPLNVDEEADLRAMYSKYSIPRIQGDYQLPAWPMATNYPGLTKYFEQTQNKAINIPTASTATTGVAGMSEQERMLAAQDAFAEYKPFDFSSPEAIKQAQRTLNQYGYNLTVDGKLGPKTKQALLNQASLTKPEQPTTTTVAAPTGTMQTGLQPQLTGLAQAKESRAQEKEKMEIKEAQLKIDNAAATWLASKDKDIRFTDMLLDSTANVINTAKKAAKLTSHKTAGWGSLVDIIPTSDAKSLAGLVDTIKSNIVIDRLSQMKEASKTGASGFGQLNLSELEALRSSIASLDRKQDPKVLKENLKIVAEYFDSLNRQMNLIKVKHEKDKEALKWARAPENRESERAAAILKHLGVGQ